MTFTLRLTKWLAPAAALFALAGALLTPVEAGSAQKRHLRPQNSPMRPEPKPTPVAESIVRGRVVYDDTTRPVRRARIMLVTSTGGRSEHSALTDGRGDFRINKVAAGSYYAVVQVPGVLSPIGLLAVDEISTSAGVNEGREWRKFFDLIEVDGKQDLTVTVHARLGATIAGRVSYADGDPAVNVHINLMRRGADGRAQNFLQTPSVAALMGLRTDDRGMFRLTGLPPGEYLVSVNELIHHGAEGGAEMGDESLLAFRMMVAQPLLVTFYPSATQEKEAAVIKVEAGEERADVDITIPERELRTINGIVRSRRGGLPVSGARVSISHRADKSATGDRTITRFEGSGYGFNGTTTDEQGRWQLVEIPDGDYSIIVKPPRAREEMFADILDEDGESEEAEAPANRNAAAPGPQPRQTFYAPTSRDLDLSGGDISEFVVEVGDGARVTGTISVEGGAKPVYWQVSMLRLGAGGGVLEDIASSGMGTEGGQFAVEGLPPGKFILQPSINGAEDEEAGEIYLKSIMWNGKDLRREPLELAEGVSVEGVRIVYGRNPATLRVTVRGGAGKQPQEEFFVTVVPADLSMWSPHNQSDFCQTEAGVCSVSASPGEYRVVALRRSALFGAYEEEVRRRAPTAPRITLREGETRRIEVEPPGDN